MKTVALKNPKNGAFTMMQLTGFGSISSDDRADYTSENKFTEYKNLADGKFGTKVSLGNVKTSLDLKETRIVTLEDDKLVKDSKISALEDDKAVKDTKIATLESDKNDKDNRVAALETDKNDKDTKMSTMESDMALLASQVSLGNVRVSLGNLATRVTSLETLGIKGISNAVSWTNLTEINVGGQTITSGGTVQAYAGGGLEKISGTSGWNAGASSVQKIDGNSDGYVQFQLAQAPIRVGLTYSDVDFENINPFRLVLSFNGAGRVGATEVLTAGTVSAGDFFRIRHYSADNTVQFQKRQVIYVDDTDFCLLQTCGLMPNNGNANNHTFETTNRPLIKAKQTANGLTAGEYYQIHIVNTSTGNSRVYTTAGVQVGWMQGRGTNWEVQKEEGQDYVTFHTHPTLTNGSDLYIDTSLYSVGSRLNDVTIVR